jgi:hypothetical protein
MLYDLLSGSNLALVHVYRHCNICVVGKAWQNELGEAPSACLTSTPTSDPKCLIRVLWFLNQSALSQATASTANAQPPASSHVAAPSACPVYLKPYTSAYFYKCVVRTICRQLHQRPVCSLRLLPMWRHHLLIWRAMLRQRLLRGWSDLRSQQPVLQPRAVGLRGKQRLE